MSYNDIDSTAKQQCENRPYDNRRAESIIQSPPGRISPAGEILSLANHIHDKTAVLNDKMEDKLNPIMNRGYPLAEDSDVTAKQCEFPPYFADLRSILDRIVYKLEDMDRKLTRIDFDY